MRVYAHFDRRPTHRLGLSRIEPRPEGGRSTRRSAKSKGSTWSWTRSLTGWQSRDGTQVGYSDSVINNICGYFVDADPKPIMLARPTIDNAKDYGEKRITPMIENCPAPGRKLNRRHRAGTLWH